MSTITANPSPQSKVSQDTAPWLKYLDEELGSDASGVEADMLSLIRGLLLAPEDSIAAVSETRREIQNYYTTNCVADETRWKEQPDHGVKGLLHCICTFAFELASQISFMDMRHERLANLLISLKSSAASEFNQDEPRLVYDKKPLLMVAGDSWNHYSIVGTDRVDNQIRERCNMWINMSAFLAKLLDADMLDIEGLHWAVSDIDIALEKRNDDDHVTELIRKCQAVVATQYILIAGRIIVKEVKFPSREWRHPLDIERWKMWAARLKEIACADTDDNPWGLKIEAGKANAKMVMLYPELFDKESKE